jgi:transcription initiation factor TFIIH subunit 4
MKCLFEDMTSLFEREENYKFLIIETNFKVYAYTSSIFDRKIVEFLFEVEYIFPGFIVAHITRNSIRKVIKRGVSFQNILHYMSMHAHPQCDYKTNINVFVLLLYL